MIPNPLDLITDAAGAVAGWSWEQVADGIARWVLGAIAEMINGVLNFLKTTIWTIIYRRTHLHRFIQLCFTFNTSK